MNNNYSSKSSQESLYYRIELLSGHPVATEMTGRPYWNEMIALRI